MARSHGKILAAIWQDTDWLALPARAQRLYMLLLSQPKLTLVGVIDYRPTRWARLARDTTPESVEQAVVALEDAAFVVVDRTTEELLIRTFVKHDLTPSRFNVNLVKGVWSAWNAVESPLLRTLVVHSIPDEVWDHEQAYPPEEAEETRRSGRLEPAVVTDRSDGPPEPPDRTTSHLSPVSSHLPPPTVEPFPTDLWTLYATKALALHRGPVGSERAWKDQTESNGRAEHGERAERLWRDFDLTANELVDVLLSPTPPQWLNTCRRPA